MRVYLKAKYFKIGLESFIIRRIKKLNNKCFLRLQRNYNWKKKSSKSYFEIIKLNKAIGGKCWNIRRKKRRRRRNSLRNRFRSSESLKNVHVCEHDCSETDDNAKIGGGNGRARLDNRQADAIN